MDGQPLSDRLTESEKRLQVQNGAFKKKFIGFSPRKLNKEKWDQINSELAPL